MKIMPNFEGRPLAFLGRGVLFYPPDFRKQGRFYPYEPLLAQLCTCRDHFVDSGRLRDWVTESKSPPKFKRGPLCLSTSQPKS